MSLVMSAMIKGNRYFFFPKNKSHSEFYSMQILNYCKLTESVQGMSP